VRTLSFRVAYVCTALACTSLLNLAAFGAAPPDTAEQARIEQAIRAYESKRQAAENNAKDQLIAAKTTALLNDPLTPVIGIMHRETLLKHINNAQEDVVIGGHHLFRVNSLEAISAPP